MHEINHAVQNFEEKNGNLVSSGSTPLIAYEDLFINAYEAIKNEDSFKNADYKGKVNMIDSIIAGIVDTTEYEDLPLELWCCLA